MVAPAIIGAGIAAGGSILGGLFGSSSQNKATQAATQAAMANLDFQKDTWADQLRIYEDALDLQRGEFRDLRQALEPYRVSGENALAATNYEMFGGERPMLTNYDALQERREILQGDKRFQNLRDQNVFALGDGEFGYGREPNYSRIERERRSVTTPGATAGSDFQVGYPGGVDPREGYTPAAPATTTTENVFTVGNREFDTRPEAREFMRDRAARNYDGDTFDSRREARRALADETQSARRNALDDASFEGGVRTEYGGYSRSPQARRLIREGSRAIEGSAAARGGMLSGDTINALSDYRTDVVKADQADYMNRLWGMQGQGLSTIGMTGSSNPLAGAALGTSVMGAGAANVGNAMGNLGTIQSQGAAAQGNIWQNVFSQLGGIGGYFGSSYLNGGGSSSGLPNIFAT